MPNPDLPAPSVTVDRALLYEAMDDMADAALVLDAGSAGDPDERARCCDALRTGISRLWVEANLHQLLPPPPGPT